ncbi:MAG: permease [Vampirovibrionia bacterium]
MNWKKEWKILLYITAVFLLFYFLPIDSSRLQGAIVESLALTKWYAQEHVLLCLIPAFFIAGAISVFISQNSIIKYFGPQAKKWVSYSIASISGSVLAVCSCTVLPLFAGIYRMGAGIGPATAFLYSGPAINVLAIILTAKVLGMELGVARAVSAILFSIIIGILMHVIFYKDELKRLESLPKMLIPEGDTDRPLYQNFIFMFIMVCILIFANWSNADTSNSIWHYIYLYKWHITAIFSLFLGVVLVKWFKIHLIKVLLVVISTLIISFIFSDNPVVPFTVALIGLSVITSTTKGESEEWFSASWEFAKQILPLLLIGVLIAGLLLGRVGHEGLIPSEYVAKLVGGNSIQSNLFASVIGAFMYFATLTEVPILKGLLDNNMGNGPALALLLSGPALSLPNMLVIKSIMGTKKTVVFVMLVVVMAAVSGIIFGTFFPGGK